VSGVRLQYEVHVHVRAHRVVSGLPKVDKTANQATSRRDWVYTTFFLPSSRDIV
jgi:hypothetical protein